MRRKCTVMDENGTLAIGKFPSVGDSRSVTRGEVLNGDAVAVIARFDRTADHARIHYLSAASMLQASRDEEQSPAPARH